MVLRSGEPTFTQQRHLVKSAFLTVLLAFSLSRLSRELNNTRSNARPRRRPIHRGYIIAVSAAAAAVSFSSPRVYALPPLFTVIDRRVDYIKRNAFTRLQVQEQV